MSNKIRTLPHSGFNKKPKYKKKQANRSQSQNPTNQNRRPIPNGSLVEPTEKYQKTIDYIYKKGFFVTAAYGNKVSVHQIKEFRVDGRDVPVLIVDFEYRNNKQEMVRRKKVYRIVRYNDKEIVGMESRNTNTQVYNRVNVKIPERTQEPRLIRKPHNNNRYRNWNNSES